MSETQAPPRIRLIQDSYIQTTGTRSGLVEWDGTTPTQAELIEIIDPHAPGNFGTRVDWIPGKTRAFVTVFVD